MAYPDRRAIAPVGDGAFSMLSGDLETAVRYERATVVVVLNNAKLGFITLETGGERLPDWAPIYSTRISSHWQRLAGCQGSA